MKSLKQRRPVYVSRIIRKRNYGHIKNINNYATDIFKATYNEKKLLDVVENMYVTGSWQNETTVESFNDYLGGLSTEINKLTLNMSKRFDAAFKDGSKKVMDSKGKLIKLEKPTYTLAIQELIKDNLKYVKNISDNQKKIILTQIKKGINDGLTFKEIGQNITQEIKRMTLSRAVLIANTEISKAMSQSMKLTMQQNNIKKYMWVTAGDNRVAPLDEALDRRIFEFDKTGKINVKGTDGKVYEINKSPMPVHDTHPRCRCVIVKAP